MKEKRTGKLDKANPKIVKSVNLSKWIRDNVTVLDEFHLKLDIEGAEYTVLSKMIEDNTLRMVDNFYVEWHYHKVGVDKSEHDRILNAFDNWKIPVEEWDAIGY